MDLLVTMSTPVRPDSHREANQTAPLSTGRRASDELRSFPFVRGRTPPTCYRFVQIVEKINHSGDEFRSSASAATSISTDVRVGVSEERQQNIRREAGAQLCSYGYCATSAGPWTTPRRLIGRTPTKRSLFIAVGRDSVPAPGVFATLRATEQKLPITLIAPAVAAAELRRFAEAEVHFVAATDAFATSGPAFALDLRKLAPPASIARLMLFRFQSKMVFEGRELELPPISFKLLGFWLNAW